MSITDTQFTQWLATDGHNRRVLIELDHAAGTEYIADRRHIARPAGQPRRIYEGALLSETGIESRLDNRPAPADIEIVNAGYKNHWLDLDFRGYEVRVYLGDITWSIDNFRLVQRAVNAGVSAIDSDLIRLDIRDGHAVFDSPVSVGTLPDGSPNPLSLGSPFNVPAAEVQANVHRYRVSGVSITSAAPRVNGSVASMIAEYATGDFRLTSAPLGNLCADVVEPHATAEQIISWVAAEYGVSVNAANLAVLPSYPLGLHYPGDVTGRQILDDVTASIGGYWRRNPLGELECYPLELPASTPDFILMPGDIVDRGVTLQRREAAASNLVINYAKNFAVTDRDGLAGILENNPSLSTRLTTEWLAASAATGSTNPTAEPITRDTYLTQAADANTEAARRAVLRSQERSVWAVDCRLAPAQITIGDTVQIRYPAFGFETGRNTCVISVRPSWSRNQVQLEVWL